MIAWKRKTLLELELALYLKENVSANILDNATRVRKSQRETTIAPDVATNEPSTLEYLDSIMDA